MQSPPDIDAFTRYFNSLDLAQRSDPLPDAHPSLANEVDVKPTIQHTPRSAEARVKVEQPPLYEEKPRVVYYEDPAPARPKLTTAERVAMRALHVQRTSA
jgi:hypothetical protein